MNTNVIDVYSRKQAIKDGIQVRCPDKIRKEAGITFPVFFTKTLWNRYIKVPKGLERFQDFEGRLWDVLYMWHHYVRSRKPEGIEMSFEVIFTMLNKENKPVQKTIELYSVIGPTDFDQPEPAITIMLPGED